MSKFQKRLKSLQGCAKQKQNTTNQTKNLEFKYNLMAQLDGSLWHSHEN